MKIRTIEQLVDELAIETGWRKKELTDLRSTVQGAAGSELLRGADKSHAHWEGFVKALAEDYLEFVCMQRCRNCELSSTMLAIVLRSKLQAAEGSKKNRQPH